MKTLEARQMFFPFYLGYLVVMYNARDHGTKGQVIVPTLDPQVRNCVKRLFFFHVNCELRSAFSSDV